MQPQLVGAVTEPVDHRPVEYAPDESEGGVLPGANVRFQAGYPFAVRSLQVQPRQQGRLVDFDLGSFQPMNIDQIKATPESFASLPISALHSGQAPS